MSASCCGHNANKRETVSPQWRRALWIALAINAAMFVLELYAGAAAGSRALQADALDFFGDSANYAISLGVAGMALAWRARAALFKGATIFIFGLYIMMSAIWDAFEGARPDAGVMGAIGFLALAANIAVALLLYRFREGDSNMRSVWICSRNDAIGNIAVMAAALGVFGTGAAWPDLIVAAIMAVLALTGGVQIIRQARLELGTDAEPVKGMA